ncbi:baseplate J/gp47 family protein [Acetobacter thailandicus]|uniref:Baseplate J/gp47 family protein n=2 Tax=Acetobacter TaxID=434 RepID=A0ABT3QDF8_9PROT|nr:baseplate J/gp47 family protein [Acetobacter thailandicus]MCX2563323.1 baseplate J/gp47 family protein [Acetobacter thailandicus]NHN94077.1 hypothetical protein [Acetobacter thailandicus]
MAVSSVSDIACTVSTTGITAPTYDAILDWYQTQYRSIYGSDVVLDNSTQDGQWIAIQAQAMNACNQAMITVFNSFSPAKAQGTALSGNVKINGITRSASTNSTCDVVITGDVGTIISNGTIQDTVNRYTWSLPSGITIPSAGSITVTATCETSGSVSAAAGTLTIIATPTSGWTSVTNKTAAATGSDAQSDASLRLQQAASTMLSSVVIMDGITGGILSLSGVTNVQGYENDTDTTDSNGLPANSIALVVKGGDASEIATVIANKKTMGTPTYGTTTETITDSSGAQRSISFFRPAETQIYVTITLKALTNYTTSIGSSAAQAVADYIAAQNIGSTIHTTRLYKPATLDDAAGGLTYDIVSIEIGTSASTASADNLALSFNERPNCTAANVTVNAS